MCPQGSDLPKSHAQTHQYATYAGPISPKFVHGTHVLCRTHIQKFDIAHPYASLVQLNNDTNPGSCFFLSRVLIRI